MLASILSRAPGGPAKASALKRGIPAASQPPPKRSSHLGSNPNTGAGGPVHDPLLSSCHRCGFTDCKGSNRGCMFNVGGRNNVFKGQRKQEYQCDKCGEAVLRNTFVSKLVGGTLSGCIVHAKCARAYYEAAGGVVEAAQSTLRYDDPNPDLLAWQKAAACHSFSGYTTGEDSSNNLWWLEGTAGCGKTNAGVVVKMLIAELGKVANPLFLVFGKNPKAELRDRGVCEASTVHSYGLNVLRAGLAHGVAEDAIMRGGTSDRSRGSAKTPTVSVSEIKPRLLVSFALEQQFGSFQDSYQTRLFTKIYRPFVSDLIDYARTSAFGCGGNHPNLRDTESLKALAEQFKIDKQLHKIVTSGKRLSVPEKNTFDRLMTQLQTTPLDFGIALASDCLELDIKCSMQTEVCGKTYFVNEVNNKKVSFPCVDYTDMIWIPAACDLPLGSFTHVIVDESGDLTPVMVGDMCQILYLWLGVCIVRDTSETLPRHFRELWDICACPCHLPPSPSQDQLRALRARCDIYVYSECHRCATAIVDAANVVASELGRPDVITSTRDVEGQILEDRDLHTNPIDRSVDTLFLARYRADIILAHLAAVSKGHVDAQLCGGPSMQRELFAALGQVEEGGSLHTLKVKVDQRLEALKPTDKGLGDYDCFRALQICIGNFQKLQPAGYNLFEPSSRVDFEGWLKQYLSSAKISDSTTDASCGTLKFSTVHAAKGLAAVTVYWVQPNHIPIPDRLAEDDNDAYEERCVHFVAITRARDSLIKLRQLPTPVTRESILTLWEPNEADEDEEEQSSSQDTVVTEAAGDFEGRDFNMMGSAGIEDEEAADRFKKALNLLGFHNIPDRGGDKVAQLRAVQIQCRAALLKVGEDADAQAELLDARALIIARIQAVQA